MRLTIIENETLSDGIARRARHQETSTYREQMTALGSEYKGLPRPMARVREEQNGDYPDKHWTVLREKYIAVCAFSTAILWYDSA